jgi:hypothetical protein
MSTDQISSFRVICEGGLNTNESTLILSQEAPGSATKLQNYESAISGGYRRINGYRAYDETYQEVGPGVGTGKVLWCASFFNDVTSQDEIYAARALLADNTKYGIFRLDAGSGWTQVTLPAIRNMTGTYSTVNRLRHVEFNFGSNQNMIIVDGVNYALWFDGTTWREIKSTNTGASSASPGGNQVVNAPNYIAIFKGTVFLAGDLTPTGRARIAYSSPLVPYDWTAANGGGQLFPTFDAVNIAPWRDELYIFGDRRIRKAIADLASGFVVQDVTDDLGCIAPDSVLEIGSNLIFLSHDGLRPVAGTDKLNDVDLGLLTQNVQPLMDDIIGNVDLQAITGVVIKKKTQFRYFWGSDAVLASESRGMLGAVRTNKRTGRSWEFGELYGIRTSCVWSGLSEGRELILHGDFDGRLFRQESGSSFDGRDILSIYSTPFLDIGATDVRKLLREINVFMDAEGTATMFLGLNFDWDLGETVTPSNYLGSVASGNTFWDSGALWDASTSIYGASQRTIIQTKLQGSCFSVKFSFVNESDDQPFIIQGFIPEYSEKGRN